MNDTNATTDTHDSAESADHKAGPKRNAIVLEADTQEKVAKIAREHKLSQGQVILTMIEMLDGKPEFTEALKAKREDKVSSRTGKTAILKKLSKLSAEELEALAASLQNSK